jgi:hypothetical protein
MEKKAKFINIIDLWDKTSFVLSTKTEDELFELIGANQNAYYLIGSNLRQDDNFPGDEKVLVTLLVVEKSRFEDQNDFLNEIKQEGKIEAFELTGFISERNLIKIICSPGVVFRSPALNLPSLSFDSIS